MKKIIFIILFFLLIAPASAQLADSPWPVFHGDVQHTGLSKYDTSKVDGTVKWTFETGGGIESSPSIGPDGTIYVGSHDGYLYAVSPDGTLKWKIKIGTPLKSEYIPPSGIASYTSILSTPSISKDGTIYIASRDQYLFAISSEGKEKWRFPISLSYESWASPPIGSDGTIYMISSSPKGGKGGVYAINPDGTEKWYYNTTWGASNSPTIDKDGTIYSGFHTSYETNTLIALNPDGTEKWRAPTELFLESSPSIGPDGTIYIGSQNDFREVAGLYAISPKGKIKWHLTLPTREVMSTPAIAKDGTIYFGDVTNGIFYAVNPNGTIKWSFATGEAIDSSPAIGAEGTIYFGSSDGKFYALNPDGTEKWHYYIKSTLPSSPAIGSDGTVYVGSWDKKLYAFCGPNKKEKVILEVEKEAPEEVEERIPEIERPKNIFQKIWEAIINFFISVNNSVPVDSFISSADNKSYQTNGKKAGDYYNGICPDRIYSKAENPNALYAVLGDRQWDLNLTREIDWISNNCPNTIWPESSTSTSQEVNYDKDREAKFEQNAFLVSEMHDVKARFFGEIARSCLDSGCTNYEETCIRWNKYKDQCYESAKTCSLPLCQKYKIYCELVVVDQGQVPVDITFDANYVTDDGAKHFVQKQTYHIEGGHGRPFLWDYDVSSDNIGKCDYSNLIAIKEDRK